MAEKGEQHAIVVSATTLAEEGDQHAIAAAATTPAEKGRYVFPCLAYYGRGGSVPVGYVLPGSISYDLMGVGQGGSAPLSIPSWAHRCSRHLFA